MGRIFIMVYKAHRGKENELIPSVKSSYTFLRKKGYLTDRPPILMQAADGSVLRIFEWKGKETMKQAEVDPDVQEEWMRVSKVCAFVKPIELDEFKQSFSEFDAISWDDWNHQ